MSSLVFADAEMKFQECALNLVTKVLIFSFNLAIFEVIRQSVCAFEATFSQLLACTCIFLKLLTCERSLETRLLKGMTDTSNFSVIHCGR